MTVPKLPAIHHITVDGEDYLATNDGYRWEKVGDGDSWAVGSKLVTEHGEVIPAGPVDRLVQLPDVVVPVRGGLCWRVGDRSTGISVAITAHFARGCAQYCLVDVAEYLAVARAIDAEQANLSTARERLLGYIEGVPDDAEFDGAFHVSVGDLRAALGEQP